MTSTRTRRVAAPRTLPINVCSEVSDHYPPIQGMYTATKHAVKGYHEALRIEIERVDEAPVSITLMQPQAVDTPFPQYARNSNDREPMLTRPMVEPREVVDAILHAAEHPTRAKAVGGMSLLNTTLAKVIPGRVDRMAASLADKQHDDEPPRNPDSFHHWRRTQSRYLDILLRRVREIVSRPLPFCDYLKLRCRHDVAVRRAV